MSGITVENLTRDYKRGRGIFDVSFEVKEGEVFGFLGPNGAGKTTTIRHLMGFIRPQSGRCEIDGMDCWREQKEIQSRIGYIPGEISLFNGMSGDEFLRFIEKYRGDASEKMKRDLIDRFELDPRGKIRKMSKGMKQKVGIVSAFMHDPDTLILDEPTSGLDPLMQNRFIDLIEGEKKRGKTILLSSHMFEEVERTCDRIAMIRAGRLSDVNSAGEIRRQHVHTYKVTLESEKEAVLFARDFKGKAEGKTVTVESKPSLEDIFLHYYDRKGENQYERGTV